MAAADRPVLPPPPPPRCLAPQRARTLNLRPYDFLDIRLRGDGHTYLANVRLDQLTGGDEEVWQSTLRTRWVHVLRLQRCACAHAGAPPPPHWPLAGRPAAAAQLPSALVYIRYSANV